MMMRNIGDWDNPAGVIPQQGWRDVKVMGNDLNADERDISPEDAARIAVLDFVFKNNDRHGGNFMYTRDQNGKVRLGLIDHGLIGMGRGKEVGTDDWESREVNPMTEGEWEAEVKKLEKRLNREGVDGYASEFNNGIRGLRNLGFRHVSDENRQRFARIVQRSIRVLEKQIDSILTEEEMERKGMKLTPAERNHLNALRKMAKARLAYLKANQADLVRKFNN